VEILVPCPTSYGKKNKIDDGKEGWDWLKEITILKSVYNRLSDEEKEQNQKLVIGELQNIERKEFSQSIGNI
jgi:hypothetical protein